MNQPLQEKAQDLRSRIAQLRNMRADKPIIPVQQQTVISVQKVLPSGASQSSLLEHNIELDDAGKPVDLALKYWVTQEVCIIFWELLDATKQEEFEQSDLLEVLEKWMIINLIIRDFKYFKLLKLCPTESKSDIFIVNFKYKNSKPAKVTLVLKLQFPLKAWNNMLIINPRTQQQLWNIHIIDGISINKKTFLQKTLERFWF